MKSKTFYEYDKACAFRDKVDGQTYWSRYKKGNQYHDCWIVWYEKETLMTRWVVKANGTIIDHAETKEKAWKIAHKYEYECANQDEPVTTIMKVEKQTIE